MSCFGGTKAGTEASTADGPAVVSSLLPRRRHGSRRGFLSPPSETPWFPPWFPLSASGFPPWFPLCGLIERLSPWRYSNFSELLKCNGRSPSETTPFKFPGTVQMLIRPLSARRSYPHLMQVRPFNFSLPIRSNSPKEHSNSPGSRSKGTAWRSDSSARHSKAHYLGLAPLQTVPGMSPSPMRLLGMH